ncbi:hypothetical protein BHE74_00044283 [Ensete ventricosum]|nr:hypothetical protein BHE74_00044283 [Ensete ventricosum]
MSIGLMEWVTRTTQTLLQEVNGGKVTYLCRKILSKGYRRPDPLEEIIYPLFLYDRTLVFYQLVSEPLLLPSASSYALLFIGRRPYLPVNLALSLLLPPVLPSRPCHPYYRIFLPLLPAPRPSFAAFSHHLLPSVMLLFLCHLPLQPLQSAIAHSFSLSSPPPIAVAIHRPPIFLHSSAAATSPQSLPVAANRRPSATIILPLQPISSSTLPALTTVISSVT